MTKIYISGKITGLPEETSQKLFRIAAKAAINKAEVMHDPHRMTINPLHIHRRFKWNNWWYKMYGDILMLRKCTHIALIPNWTDSKGATIEFFIGKFILKLKVIELTDKDMKWRNEI